MKLSLGDLALKVDASSVEVEKNDGSFTDQASVNALLIQELNDLAANAGGAVTVSDRLPDPSDGDDGQWWIYQPTVQNPFWTSNLYEKGAFLGTFDRGVSLSTSNTPLDGRINANTPPDAADGSTTTWRASKVCNDGSGGKITADFWNSLNKGSELVMVEHEDTGGIIGLRGTQVYQFDDVSELTNCFSVSLTKLEHVGMTDWIPSSTFAHVYLATEPVDPPDPPELEDYEEGAFLGNYRLGVEYSTSTSPPASRIHSTTQPDHGTSTTTHRVSEYCVNESGASVNATFWENLSVGDLVYYKTYEPGSEDTPAGLMVFEVVVEATSDGIDSGYQIMLNRKEWDGLTTWDESKYETKVFTAKDKNAPPPPDPPDEPDETSNTLFYKDSGEWIQIGGTGGGAGGIDQALLDQKVDVDGGKITKSIDLQLTDTQRWAGFRNRNPLNPDGSNATGTEWGIEMDIDSGNSYRSKFAVQNRYGKQLLVSGGASPEVQVGPLLDGKTVPLKNNHVASDDDDVVNKLFLDNKIKVVDSVPSDTDGNIGDVVFVVNP